jgi:opacity protein-like surface antigen
MRGLPIAIVLVLVCATIAAASAGSVGFGMGVTTPRGQANRYAGSSFSIMLFGKFNVPQTPALGIRLTGAGTFLEDSEHDVNIAGWDLFTEKYSSDLYRLTIGTEVAPTMGVFEPYAGVGVGLHYFSNSVTLVDHNDEEIDSKNLGSEWDTGWYAMGGLRLHVTSYGAVDIGVHYDKIKNMDHLKAKELQDIVGLESESVDTEYISVYLGFQLLIPFETKDITASE